MKNSTRSNIHFISGLPRSGSTLLAALLRQNPRFSAAMSSPLVGIYSAAQVAMSGKNELHIFIKENQRESVLRGIFQNFYVDINESSLIFDTNRAWCAKLSGLAKLFPECKVLCCVRSVAWILDSIEQVIQKNALEPSGIFHFEQYGSIYTRIDALTGPGGLVRTAHDGLQEAFLSDNANRLLFIQYDSLARSPGATLSAIYDFLGQELFPHDFANVEYEADEYDRTIGTPGLHRVRKGVKYLERSTILPPDVFARFEKPFWKDPIRNIRNVRIV